MRAFFSEKLQQAWVSDSLLSRVLLPASWLYGMLAGIRRWLYATGRRSIFRADVPVIVIGSVVTGGSGKTPIVIETVQRLQAMGWRVGVVSRGYGRSNTTLLHTLHQHSTPAEAGDEPLLIYRQTGAATAVCSNRARAVRQLCSTAAVDVIVCDDGLQHWQLHRDAEVIVLDERGIGNGRLLPAGMLRETLSAYMPSPQEKTVAVTRPLRLLLAPKPIVQQFLPHFSARCAATVLSAPSEQSAAETVTENPENHHSMFYTATAGRSLKQVAYDADGNAHNLTEWAEQPVAAVAGIARPTAFFDMLTEQGLKLAHTVAAQDHADFAAGSTYHDSLSELKLPLFCTEKDAEKLRAAGIVCFSVGLDIRLGSGYDRFLQTFVHQHFCTSIHKQT